MSGIGHDAMRWIDRWAGMPLCGLLTLADRLSGRARQVPAGEVAAPKAVAFLALAEIGALVVAYPAVTLARRRFPDARHYFVTFPGGRDVLRLCGFADDEIILLDPSSPLRFATSTLKAIVRLRQVGVEATVNFETFARFSTLLAYLSGARWRAGFHPLLEEGHSVGDLVTHRVLYSPHLHAARSYMAVVETLAQPRSDDPGPKVPLVEAPIDRFVAPVDAAGLVAMRKKLAARCSAAVTDGARLVILNANASDLVAVRRWPVSSYVELAHRLLAADDRLVIVLTGTRSESAVAAALAAAIGNGPHGGDRIANMAGETSFAGLLDLYRLSAVMVTNDSGPAHFASLTDLATVVLFGPETPRIFGPLGPRQEALYRGLGCSPCVSVYNQKRTACADNVCITGITVETVMGRVMHWLETPGDE